MNNDAILFLGFFAALILYLVISAKTEMGTKLPKFGKKNGDRHNP